MAALASAYHPAVVLAVSAGLGLAGTAAVALAPQCRHLRAERSGSQDTAPARRLAAPAVLLLFVSLTGTGFAIGAMNVWSIAMAEHHHQDMLSGILPAAFSTASFFRVFEVKRCGMVMPARGDVDGAPFRPVVARMANRVGSPPGGCHVRAHRSTSKTPVSWAASYTQPFLTGHHHQAADHRLGCVSGRVAAAPFPAGPVCGHRRGCRTRWFLTVMVACAYVTTDALTPAGRTSEAYA
ncbi:hypothetical protein [Streptomyces sp. NPDC005078]|uniref:hypothetical protein n=1 Tax=Streptomyces sp. NPDC005078 TaxID=3154293 RepID=UPI0033B9A0A9